MTRSEWDHLAATIQDYWPQRALGDGTLEAWWADVRDVPGEIALAAVQSLAREGREFAPTGGQIRARAAELVSDDADHSEVWDALQRAVHKFGHGREAEALEWVAEHYGPSASEAIRRLGYRDYCHSDLDDQATWRAQLRRVCEDVGERSRRERVGAPTRRDQVAAGDGLRKLDAAAMGLEGGGDDAG